ncbi:unnamed protein product, partial [marine sediment metagenome]
QVNVVLVKTDLAAGTVLNGTNVEAVAIPREVADRALGLYLFEEVTMGVTKVYRTVAMNDLLRGRDMEQRVAVEHVLAKLMKDNRQAISFPVDSREPSAFVVPGSRVDLWGPVYIPGQTARTQLIIENLEVLSVDGQTDPEQVRRNFRSVEVHVPTELVSKLKEVQRRLGGPLSLSVRAPNNMIMKYPYDRTHPELGGTIAKPVADSLARPFAGERARRFDEDESAFDQ